MEEKLKIIRIQLMDAINENRRTRPDKNIIHDYISECVYLIDRIIEQNALKSTKDYPSVTIQDIQDIVNQIKKIEKESGLDIMNIIKMRNENEKTNIPPTKNN